MIRESKVSVAETETESKTAASVINWLKHGKQAKLEMKAK
jgi:hypothetical protein